MNTEIYAALSVGPLRRSTIVQQFGMSRIDHLENTDKSGLTLKWTLEPQSKFFRAVAFTLNTKFPLAAEMRAVLQRMRKAGGINLEEDDVPAPIKLPSPKFDITYLFGSPVRTNTLAALECLGGKAETALLRYAVPDELSTSTKNAMRNLTFEGILTRNGPIIQFAKAPWLKEMRALLRAYVRKRDGFAERVSSLVAARRIMRRDMNDLGLVGKIATERFLTTVARNGPTPPYELHTLAQVGEQNRLLPRHLAAGVLAQGIRGGVTVVSLNRAHPAYRQIRALLLAIGGKSREKGAGPDLSSPQADYSVHEMFGTEARFDVLFCLAINDWTDVSSLEMVVPQHDKANVSIFLDDLAALKVVQRKRLGNLLYSRLNPKYQHYSELKALLEAAARMDPVFYAAVRRLGRLYTEAEAARRRNRPKTGRM